MTRNECLSKHNQYRQQHSRNALSYGDQLEAFAQQRANKIAQTDEMVHPAENEYGENLFQAVGNYPATCKEAVDQWYNEIKDHDQNGPAVQPKTGHYTQVIWKDSQSVGCASAKSQRQNIVYIVVCISITFVNQMLS